VDSTRRYSNQGLLGVLRSQEQRGEQREYGPEEETADPTTKLAVVASASPQEAALLAGRLQADAIRAMASTGHPAPGP
jgi:hypothetical protein